MSAPSFSRRVPEGDNRPRLVCDHCGFVDYVNPRIVVGAVCSWEDRILLCRRAIEPRKGFWTLPAGFLEEREGTEEGAAREAREEALAEIEIDALLAVYDVPRISQVHIFYRARLRSPEVGVGEESAEVGLFGWPDIPWDEIAFPSVHWALQAFEEVRGKTVFAPRRRPDADVA
jgi:ADP-ribose pyrophosphatase YjhB (NUDIX family)